MALATSGPAGLQLWSAVIGPSSPWPSINLRDLWRYRDLVRLFVHRDFVAYYSQTILGPLWYVIQPVLTTLMFVLVFGRVARLPTDGVPSYVFYMAGVVLWGYFAGSVTRTSTTLVANAHLFGKVWFPRLVVPVAAVISNLVAFAIQVGILLLMIGWSWLNGQLASPGIAVLLVPLVVLEVGALALGFGLVFSSVTARYRDLAHLLTFGVQLWMFATPVVYPASAVPGGWQWLLYVNPMAPPVEMFRRLLLGAGTVDMGQMVASAVLTAGVLVGGLMVFSRVEKSFVDGV